MAGDMNLGLQWITGSNRKCTERKTEADFRYKSCRDERDERSEGRRGLISLRIRHLTSLETKRWFPDHVFYYFHKKMTKLIFSS